MRNLILSIFLVLCFINARANYIFDANCRAAYLAAWSFRSNESQKYIDLESHRSPSNNIPVYIASLNRFIEVFSNEQKSVYDKFKAEKEIHIDALNKDEKGPWYLYCKSEIYIQGAVLKLKFSDYYGASFDFNKAYPKLTECNEKYPDFLPARKDLLLLKRSEERRVGK